ncbi:UNVERIFIED_CONTAM: hypothetical protein GTU68_043788 [Idotea baltica]|nr:hypothetical protein [Idotea baltica]
MALLLAKEQFARRSRTSNIWVVPSASILTFESEETEIFTTTPEKKHREAAGYRVRDKVNSYKKRLKDE